MTADTLKAPFPYFGGKSRIASLVWERFGCVRNYVEPFFGSGAMLLGAPWPADRTETVNDIDGLLANLWRALALAPDEVARYADWPVNECDLHARHRYLRDRRGYAEELMSDPEAYDAKLAGWWVWGISQWIGSGWCPPPAVADVRELPHVGDGGRGVHRAAARPSGDEWKVRPFLSHNGQGVNRELPRKRPIVAGSGSRTHRGLGVHRASLSRQIPHLGGTHVDANGRKNGSSGKGVFSPRYENSAALCDYFAALSTRLRRVRVCCGDWRRVTGPSVTFRHGLTAVFLDPPYAQDARADVYAYEHQIFEDVRAWAIENGDNPLMRIALCGYDFEMPEDWEIVHWKAAGGYGLQGDGRGRENAKREMVAFSPHCLGLNALPMFAYLEPTP